MAKLACFFISFVLLGSAMAELDYSESVDGFSGHFFQSAVLQPKLKNKNVVLSAFSVNQVLSMVAFGAQGETKREILDSLELKDLESSIPSIRATIDDLNNPKGVTLKLANKVYARPSASGKLTSVAPSYKSSVENVFKSEIQQVNFAHSAETAALINRWVEDHTNNRIKDLISPDSIDATTAAVLVNAIYFKGLWAKKFDKSRTTDSDFTRADGSVVKVRMMNKMNDYKYKDSKELNSKILVLPYEKEEVFLVLILPNESVSLEEVENKLSNGTLKYLNHMYEYEVTVAVPTFKIESTINVKEVLENMGVRRIFDPKRAQLGGILEENVDLVVSEAIQKAFIEVNEEGAEAAAATEFGISYNSAMVYMGPKINFIADRPFILSLLQKNIVLFNGKVLDPAS